MYCGPKSLLFVEYKYVKELPKRDSTFLTHSLSPLQAQWLERINGPSTAVLIIGVNDTAIIIPSDFANNISKLRVEAEGISRKDVANWIYQVTVLGRNPNETNTKRQKFRCK